LWEGYATTLANTSNADLGKAYEKLVNDELVDELRQIHDRPAKVIFGRDTRPSGVHLVKALKAALDATHVEYTDYGILTTPQLHYLVRCINTKGTPYDFGEATEKGYYDKMANAFKLLMHGRTIQGPIIVDCANGVGGPKLRELIKYLPSGSDGGIDIKVINDDILKPEVLNSEVSSGPSAVRPKPDVF
jgi:phosphoacetylglucosamine mutase